MQRKGVLQQSVLTLSISMTLMTLTVSCQEPNYRTEVVANGQGGVVTRKIPKDLPVPVEATVQPPKTASQPTMSIDQQIEILQSKARDINAEIDRLTKLKAAKND